MRTVSGSEPVRQGDISERELRTVAAPKDLSMDGLVPGVHGCTGAAHMQECPKVADAAVEKPKEQSRRPGERLLAAYFKKAKVNRP